MNIQEIGEKICHCLVSVSKINEAKEIHELIMLIINEAADLDKRKDAVDDLLSRCHPRWLRDYYIDIVTYQEWNDLISRFKHSLNKYKRKNLMG